jgi:hypothetical protein
MTLAEHKNQMRKLCNKTSKLATKLMEDTHRLSMKRTTTIDVSAEILNHAALCREADDITTKCCSVMLITGKEHIKDWAPESDPELEKQWKEAAESLRKITEELNVEHQVQLERFTKKE